MIKLHHHLARLIAPVFLLQALSLQAETTSTTPFTITPSPTTALPTSSPVLTTPSPMPLTTVACENIQLPEQTTGVRQRLEQHTELTQGRQCIILSADASQDLSELIQRIPENTVILLSSDIVQSATSSPSMDMEMTSTSMELPTSSISLSSSPTASPTQPANIPAEYFIGHEVAVKNGQDIVGAADEGYEIVIREHNGFDEEHMVKIGTTNSFHFSDKLDSNIRHVTFKPARDNRRRSIDSIIFAECYNRTLIVENNRFHLDTRAAVFLDCKEALDASAGEHQKGPGLQFTNNTIIGESFRIGANNFIPDEGLFISLPAITNHRERLSVLENTFQGNMAEAGEFTLATGSTIDIFRNNVTISNAGYTRSDAVAARKGGFVLTGPSNTSIQPPLFNMAGNNIQVTRTAITVRAKLDLALACNQLRAVNPWQQPMQQFRLGAADPTVLESECEGYVSSTVAIPTPSPGATSSIMNTWTAINDSTATACDGLVNLEGQFFFDSEICQPITPSSAGTTTISAAISVLVGIAILLAL